MVESVLRIPTEGPLLKKPGRFLTLPQRENALYGLLLFLCVSLAYAGAFPSAFLYDDEFLILKNRFLTSFEYLPQIFSSSSTGGAGYVDSFYRPLQTLAYLIVQQLFGQETWAFHGLNILLHGLNTVLLFLLGQKMGLFRRFAFAGALIWAMHPLHTEAVTYMSATADPLHALFLLSGLLVMVPVFTKKQRVVAALFFVLALLSKESAVVFPALAITMVFFFSSERQRPQSYFVTWPFWAMAFGYLFLRQSLLNFNQDFSMYKEANLYTESFLYRLQTFWATLPSYLSLLVWPVDLHMDRAFPVFTNFLSPLVLAGFILFAGCLFFIGRGLRQNRVKSPWLAWVPLWFFAAHVPQAGVLIPVNSFFLEHWMYVPSLGIFLGVAAFTQGCGQSLGAKGQQFLLLGLLLIAGALGLRTFDQNRVWESPVTFFSHILKYNPESNRVRHNLAMAYTDEGKLDLAKAEYLKVLQTSEEYYQTHHNLARIYASQNQLDLAEKHELRAIELSPKFFPAYGTLADIYRKKGDAVKAAEAERKFKELSPR